MNYIQFKNRVQNLPLIISRDVVRLERNSQIIRNQFNRWQAKGLIVRLKRGVYLLNKDDRKVNPSRNFIANQLHGPSYVSLEYALNFYGLIPERVSDVTSVTTKKTMRFKNDLGVFVYQHIKPDAFRGFKKIEDESGLSFFAAEPEKAVVDFLYLNLKKFLTDALEVFESSYRFQNTDSLKKSKIIEFAKLFHNKRLVKVAQEFCEFIRRESRR